MSQSLNRLALAFLFLLSTVATADAAVISINEISTGGGTLVNDGTSDVASSDGSATGSTSLMSQLGFTNLNLAADLGLLRVNGLITDPFVQNAPAVSADLIGLRLIGTLATGTCATCATIDQVRMGSSIGGGTGGTQNVLFAFAIVGVLSPLNPLPWTPPPGLNSPINFPIGSNFSFGLTTAQINFIVSRMTSLGYGVNDVRFGLAASADGVTATGGSEGVRTQFSLEGPVPVPEPGTLLLLGSGLAAAGFRRVRRRLVH